MKLFSIDLSGGDVRLVLDGADGRVALNVEGAGTIRAGQRMAGADLVRMANGALAALAILPDQEIAAALSAPAMDMTAGHVEAIIGAVVLVREARR